jgi:hypothetical protein
MPDGGFVYRLDEPFIHMGIEKTATPANQSNLFPTWFRLHTLALISEILNDEPCAGFDWKFNQDCSMGWHEAWDKQQHALSIADILAERQFYMLRNLKRVAAKPYHFSRRSLRFVKRKLARN